MAPQMPSEIVLWLMAATMGLPLVAFFIVFFLTRRSVSLSCGVSIFCSAVPLASAWYLLVKLWHLEAPLVFQLLWLVGEQTKVTIGFLLDPLSLTMLCIVCTISFLIQIYSLGYMAGDPGKSRYYGFLSFFAWSMISLVAAAGMVQLYVFWELVGLSSYFLIGFWHHKFSASEAGKKAFVMTRFGDLGFFFGIVVLLLNFGDLSILRLNSQAASQLSTGLVYLSAILIFCGVIGKSAQFPLLTWLPDAMEGPTPVSALLHSATMVAAGVYLVSRLFPFYAASPGALVIVLTIGTITMFLSSTMAMVARDIKQIWAYSTVSQLGLMLMGLGAGSYFAGFYHLTTHAAFKALLFLCSGVFIHHFGTNDFFDMAKGGGRRLKVPMITITIAGAALSGVFPMAGFFSKEAVMGALAELSNPVWLGMGLLGAAMTAYYTFRCLFVLWFPKKIEAVHRGHDAHGHSGHQKAIYWVMAVPLIILAAFTVYLGWAGEEIKSLLYWHEDLPHEVHHAWLLWASIIVVAIGVGVAYLEFGRKGAAQEGFLARVKPIETFFAQRWYLDAIYRRFLDYVIYGVFSRLFTLNDRRAVDGGIDGLCRGTVGVSVVLSYFQSGKLQYNILATVIIVTVLGLYFLLA